MPCRVTDGETFAERFAQKLLFPESIATKALEALRSAGDRMAAASWFAGSFDVSIVAVVKAADRVAKQRGEAPTGLDTEPFYGAWRAQPQEISDSSASAVRNERARPTRIHRQERGAVWHANFPRSGQVPSDRGTLASVCRRHAERQHGRRAGALSGTDRVVGLTVRRRLAEQLRGAELRPGAGHRHALAAGGAHAAAGQGFAAHGIYAVRRSGVDQFA